MKLLLDTHVLLWAAGSPERLSATARVLLEDPQNELLFSAASLWEIVIKCGLGRSDFHVDARVLRRSLLDNGYQELAISSEHAVFIDSWVLASWILTVCMANLYRLNQVSLVYYERGKKARLAESSHHNRHSAQDLTPLPVR